MFRDTIHEFQDFLNDYASKINDSNRHWPGYTEADLTIQSINSSLDCLRELVINNGLFI